MASKKGIVYSFPSSFVLESKTRKIIRSKSSLVGVDSRHRKLTHVDESEIKMNSISGVEILHHPFKTLFEIREKVCQPLSSSTCATMATNSQCLQKISQSILDVVSAIFIYKSSWSSIIRSTPVIFLLKIYGRNTKHYKSMRTRL